MQTGFSFAEANSVTKVGTHRTIGTGKSIADVVLIVFFSLAAEAGHFTWKQGRHLICGDSVQYVDGAEALLGQHDTAHFEYRKPGYSIMLAATALLFGNMGWAAVAVHHLFQSLLPLAAYGLGRSLRGRGTGWLAAVLVIARLQAEYRGERIMSESVYATVITIGILVFVYGVSRTRFLCWTLGSGLLFGAAWLTRSVAIAVIVAAAITLIWSHHRTPLRALGALCALLMPVVGFVGLECALNYRFAGQFRTGTSTLGPALLIRTRAYNAAAWPDTDACRQSLSLLPERDAEDAYLANKLDAWVAWHRAVQEKRMDDWQVDALMTRAALDVIAADPWAYWTSVAEVFTRHALRRPDEPTWCRVPLQWQQPLPLPTGTADTSENRESWYAHWTLPKRTSQQAADLVQRLHAAEDTKAPFGDGGWWSWLRWFSRTPITSDVLGLLRSIGALWPGFALLACGSLGLHRRTCALLGLAYLLDATIVALTASDLGRLQFVWLGPDTALAAALVAGLVSSLGARIRAAGQYQARSSALGPAIEG